MSAGVAFETIKFLTEQIAAETSLQYAVPDKIRELIRELEMIRAFLEDAEKKQRGEERIRKWIDDVRDISYSVEDELDKYNLVVEKRRHQNWVLRYACIFKFLVKRHQIGTGINYLQQRIEGISRSRSTYGIENIGEINRQNEEENENLRLQRRWDANEENFSFVGLQDDLKHLKDRLLDTKENRRCCISVVGMGGLGKTTIARKVYEDVRMCFDCSAWVYISQEFKIEDVLKKIRRDIQESERKKDEIIEGVEELRHLINELLKGKRYLVVLDDVWNHQLWQNSKRVFPDENNGSRLLITTRNEEVARYVDPITSPHNLRLLDEDESWKLFCQKALLVPGEDPDILLDLGKRVTGKCGGLPLAIVVLGGLLSRKPKHFESWLRVLNSISSVLSDSPERCKKILAMSFDDLPFNMKPCFLYLGLFPEDTDIPAKRLIQFWVAENLVQAEQNEREDAAVECLEELISRCLVQVAKRGHGGGVKLCRIHDLLRDLAIEEAKKDNFLHTCTPETAKALLTSTDVHRLSIQFEVPQKEEVCNLCTNRLRSLFVMPFINMGQVKELIPKIQLIRILDLGGFTLTEFPKEINQLIHLRYLGLDIDTDLWSDRGDRLLSTYRECFESWTPPLMLSNLKHLQTLEFNDSELTLSISIWTLHQLRHFHGENVSIYPFAERIDRLKNLQTLHLIGGDWIDNGLENLSNLRDLRISDISPRYDEGLSKALKKLLYLRVLKLTDINTKLPSLSHMQYLQKLLLEGEMESLPDEFPPNLVKLKCYSSELKLESDLFATLQNLKELKFLGLRGRAEEGSEINVFSGGFPKLEVLKINTLETNFTLNVEEGAICKLKRFYMPSAVIEHVLSEGLSFPIGSWELWLDRWKSPFRLYVEGIVYGHG